jgi:hypothetical protein
MRALYSVCPPASPLPFGQVVGFGGLVGIGRRRCQSRGGGLIYWGGLWRHKLTHHSVWLEDVAKVLPNKSVHLHGFDISSDQWRELVCSRLVSGRLLRVGCARGRIGHGALLGMGASPPQ